MKTQVPDLDDPRILRNVFLGDTGYRLLTWDIGSRMATGQCRIGYAFFAPESDEPLFSGADFGCSPMHAIDSDDTLRGILSFLTLRKGDTDSEYFEKYTPDQLAFADSEAEELQIFGMDQSDLEEDELQEYARFVDVEG